MRPLADTVRPRYGPYLAWWCGTWLLITVLTQMPEYYERSLVLAPWEHSSIGSEMIGFAGGTSLIELICGLLWGSLSWLLQWGFAALRSFWPRVPTVVLLVCVEGLLLGLPLANINTSMANFSLAGEDTPPVTISDGSIRIESIGILLAFPLACLVAGRMAAKQTVRDF